MWNLCFKKRFNRDLCIHLLLMGAGGYKRLIIYMRKKMLTFFILHHITIFKLGYLYKSLHHTYLDLVPIKNFAWSFNISVNKIFFEFWCCHNRYFFFWTIKECLAFQTFFNQWVTKRAKMAIRRVILRLKDYRQMFFKMYFSTSGFAIILVTFTLH